MGPSDLKRGYRTWSLEEKRAAVARMDSCTHTLLAAELGIHKRVLYAWREHVRLLDQRAKARLSRDQAIAALNLPKSAPIDLADTNESVEDIVTDPTHGTLAPIAPYAPNPRRTRLLAKFLPSARPTPKANPAARPNPATKSEIAPKPEILSTL